MTTVAEPTFDEPSPQDISGAEERVSSAVELRRIIDARLSLMLKLAAMEEERRELLAAKDLPEAARGELDRQIRELRRLPSGATARDTLNQLKERLADYGGENDPAHPLYREAVELGRRQCAIFIERERMVGPLLRHAAALALEEELFALLEPTACQPHVLFGWAVYSFAIQEIKHEATVRRESLRQQPDESAHARIGQLDVTIQAATRELAAIEPVSVEAFWSAYEEAAVLLAGGCLMAGQETRIRAFLRYGMIGSTPYFLSAEVAERLLAECGRSQKKLDDSVDATHVLYADEYIDLSARGLITPSIDEDLELNQRRSVKWMRDKYWRRVISARTPRTPSGRPSPRSGRG